MTTLSVQRYMEPDSSIPLIQLLKERSKKDGGPSISIAIESGDRFHESVLIEILSWLPVKILLQYKSVCKSWYAIISSPDFISKHLENYYKNNYDGRGTLLAQYYCHLKQADIQSLFMLVDESETPRVLAHENLIHMPMYSSYIYGPCDGLYYLYHFENDQRAIWNPAINELKVLPSLITKPNPPLNTTLCVGEFYGFGFDPASKDYKVVVIRGYAHTIDDSKDFDYPQSVFVYSLRNDSWSYCGDLLRYYGLSHGFNRGKCYNYVNGCCYWLETDFVYEPYKTCDAIISFNLATDAFEEINLPSYNQPSSKCLGVYDDSIALLSLHENDKTFEIWTLKEGIWTLKSSTGPFLDVWYVVGHWKDNKVILESEYGDLFLLDHESQDIKHLGYQNPKHCEGIFSYGESLVSVVSKSRCGLLS